MADSLSGLLSLMRDHPPERSCTVRLWNPHPPMNLLDHEFDRSMEHLAAKQLPVEILIADQRLVLLGPFVRGWDPARAMMAVNDQRLAGLLIDQSRRDAVFGSAMSKPFILAPSGPWHRFIESKLRRVKKSIDCISVEPEWAQELHRAWKEGIVLRGMVAIDTQRAPGIERFLAEVSTLTLIESRHAGQGGASVFILDRESILIAFPAHTQPASGGSSSVNQPSLAIELADPTLVQESSRWIEHELAKAVARRTHRLQHSLR